MKRVVRIFLWVLGAVFAVAAALTFYEVTVFTFRTEASALELAKIQFVNVCAREGINPTEFSSPQRIERKDRAYEFVWTNSSNGDQILALTSYLPLGSEAWLVRGEDMRAIKDRLKMK
jgi:hypothetical protein